jgi:magnesium transporter
MLYLDERQEVNSEQVSLVLGPNYVLSFQETERDFFRTIRDRIRDNKGRLRKMGADYLAYSLIDVIVDNYFVIMETLGEKIEGIEMALISNPVPQTLRVLHDLKRTMVTLRRSVWPLREVISGMLRSESTIIKDTTEMYLKDVYDHTVQVIDTIESYRDILAGMMDIYLSSVSNRLNEVMKVLTIIATIFIPLTFIVGLYGMNFKYMPELHQWWGYPAVLLVMLAVTVFMLFFFRRKKWI